MVAVKPSRKDEAYSVEEAKSYKSPKLIIAQRQLTAVPPEISTLRNLVSLDLSDNPIEKLEASALPRQLEELRMTGCELHPSVPAGIAELPSLERLFCGANKLECAESLFHCTRLKHLGLSYNNISSLPTHIFPSLVNLLSLDLSHNSLPLTAVDQLAKLPNLRALSLQGNPMCLMPQYKMEVTNTLTKLVFLDGQKVDSLSASRAVSREANYIPIKAHNPTVDTYMEVALSGMLILEDSFAWLTELWAKQAAEAEAAAAEAATAAAAEAALKAEGKGGGKQTAAAAAAAAAAGAAAAVMVPPPIPPPQPVYYHAELADPEGCVYASLPFLVYPPQSEVAEVDPKGKGKGKKPASNPSTPLKGGKGAPPLEEPKPALNPGSLSMQLRVTANTQWRDWIRSGITVNMYRTRMEAVPKPVEPEEERPIKTPEKGKKEAKPKKGEEPDPIDMSNFDVVAQPTELLGIAHIDTSKLVTGDMKRYDSSVPAIPKPALWDSKGIRMALEDPRHSKEPVAMFTAQVTLHVEPKVICPPAVEGEAA